jgi:DNA polymerase alpha subunit B
VLYEVLRHALVHAKTSTRSASRVSFSQFMTVGHNDSTTASSRLIIMAELNNLFAPSGSLPPDVTGELESILRLHSISAQELFYKWESYSLKMGSEDTKLDLNTVRMFKKDVQDSLERNGHDRHVGRGADKKSNVGATPRNMTTGGDVFGMQVFTNPSPAVPANHGLQA